MSRGNQWSNLFYTISDAMQPFVDEETRKRRKREQKQEEQEIFSQDKNALQALFPNMDMTPATPNTLPIFAGEGERQNKVTDKREADEYNAFLEHQGRTQDRLDKTKNADEYLATLKLVNPPLYKAMGNPEPGSYSSTDAVRFAATHAEKNLKAQADKPVAPRTMSWAEANELSEGYRLAGQKATTPTSLINLVSELEGRAADLKYSGYDESQVDKHVERVTGFMVSDFMARGVQQLFGTTMNNLGTLPKEQLQAKIGTYRRMVYQMADMMPAKMMSMYSNSVADVTKLANATELADRFLHNVYLDESGLIDDQNLLFDNIPELLDDDGHGDFEQLNYLRENLLTLEALGYDASALLTKIIQTGDMTGTIEEALKEAQGDEEDDAKRKPPTMPTYWSN